jgi:hypothetical protein
MREKRLLDYGEGGDDGMISVVVPLRISLAPDTRIVTVYHGTSLERATLAIACQEIVPSHNEWDWLGDGIYFWEGSLDRAISWAQKKNADSAAVIMTEVRLGRCLDLFDTKWVTVVRAAHRQLLNAYATKSTPPPVNRRGNHALDRAVINHVCENLYEIDTVRGPFLEGESIFPQGSFSNLTHVQIAVRNPSAIVGPLRLEFPLEVG